MVVYINPNYNDKIGDGVILLCSSLWVFLTFIPHLMGCEKLPSNVLQRKVVGQIAYRTKTFQKKKVEPSSPSPSQMAYIS
jgi:hypothetical protein